jgi:undecaprenyl-diphosphatase
MSTLEILILALLQGLTEFLPISSSAHLILPSQILGWHDQGIGFDVSVHVGTLLAVMLYFRKEIGVMAVAWFGTMGLGPEKKTIELRWYFGLVDITCHHTCRSIWSFW